MTPERENKIIEVISKRQSSLTIILENVHDPHNISAVLRSCDAVGVQEVHVINTMETSEKKMGKKSSASANKWVKVCNYDSVDSCINKLKEEEFFIYSTYLSTGSASLYELDLTKRIALAFGNEHQGVSQEILNLSDGNFDIPQVGMIPSLNISVACAVTLYEAYRQRNNCNMYDERQYSNDKFNKLLAEFKEK